VPSPKLLPIGPRRCVACGATPEEKRLLVHHVDGDHSHDVPENVEWRCRGCHMRVHNKDEARRQAIAESQRNSPTTQAHLQVLHESNRGKSLSETHRRASADGHRGKRLSEAHRRAIAEGVRNSSAAQVAAEVRRGKLLTEAHKQAIRDGWARRRERLAAEKAAEGETG
jgi:hypothetical protein